MDEALDYCHTCNQRCHIKLTIWTGGDMEEALEALVTVIHVINEALVTSN